MINVLLYYTQNLLIYASKMSSIPKIPHNMPSFWVKMKHKMRLIPSKDTNCAIN